MNPDVAKIAQQSLDVFHEQLSPVYGRLMEEFGATALNAAQLADMQTNAQHEKANRALISEFVQNLGLETKDVTAPNPNWGGRGYNRRRTAHSEVSTTTPEAARLAQSLLLWVPSYHRDDTHFVPYLIIGCQQAEPAYKGGPDTRLLLVSPVTKDDKTGVTEGERFVIMDTWATAVDQFETTGLNRLTQPYTTTALEAMFDTRSETLKVNAATDQSVVARVATRGKIAEFIGFGNDLEGRLDKTKPQANTLHYNGVTYVAPIGISETELSSFGTPTYLNRLATLFGKTELLATAIDEAVVTSEEQLETYIKSGGINPEDPQV